jgi:hypothetical protein
VNDQEETLSINSESTSIQTHLSIIQNIIQRMADNSSACKTWCVTLVTAVLIIVADKGNPDYAFIALLPAVVFAALDTAYLGLEKAFRNSYDDFILKLHSKTLTINDLYSIKPKGKVWQLQFKALKSFSVWGFYLPLIVLIVITKIIAIG